MDTIWKILGIEPTKDRKKITAAYRSLLSKANPEERPEEFMELRDAYEQALRYCEEENDEENARSPLTPVEQWRNQLEELYRDFPRRIDPGQWKMLLNSPVCVSIDTRAQAEERMLAFFMEKWFIPHTVWQLIDSTFGLSEEIDSLYERYPADFLDYVIFSGIRYNDVLPFEMYEPGKNGEECEAVFRLFGQIRKNIEENAPEVISQMEMLSERHPYLDAIKLSYLTKHGDEERKKELEALAEKHSRVPFILGEWAIALSDLGEYEESVKVARSSLDINPDNVGLSWNLADSLSKLGQYQEAVNVLNNVARNNRDPRIFYEVDRQRRQWNEFIIEEDARKLERDPDNDQLRLDLCWAYFENDMMEETVDTVSLLGHEKPDPFSYYNLQSSIAAELGRWDEAIELTDSLIFSIEQMPPEDERKKRLGEMWLKRAMNMYGAKKDISDIAECYLTAMEKGADRREAYDHLVALYMVRDDYEKAVEYARASLRINPDSFTVWYRLSYSLFCLRQDGDAFDAINRAIDINPSDSDMYVLKARILIRNGVADQAREILGMLCENGLEKDPGVVFCMGLAERLEKNDDNAAEPFFKEAIRLMEKDNRDYDFAAELYYRYLIIVGRKLDATVKRDRSKMLTLTSRGLASDPKHEGLMDYRAWLLARRERYAEALELYEKLRENKDHDRDVDYQIGIIHYRNVETESEECIKSFRECLDRGGDINAHFYLGMSLLFSGQLDGAEEQFRLLEEARPDSIDAPHRLALVCMARSEYDEAIKHLNRAIDRAEKRRKWDFLYLYVLKGLVLRRMKDPVSAIKTYHEADRRHDMDYHTVVFETYVQFGMLSEAEKLLKNWKPDTQKGKSEKVEKEIVLAMLSNDFPLAEALISINGKMLGERTTDYYARVMAKNRADYEEEIRLLKSLLKFEGRNGDKSLYHNQLALRYFRMGDSKNRKAHARKAIELIDKKLEEASLGRTLYLSRKTVALAILGRFEECDRLTEEVRKRPLCESCPYAACKDMDQFERDILEIKGDLEGALALARKRVHMWPDEESFVIMINNLSKPEGDKA
ncbi:MAG: tetratricopeptide repeat protein [Oscillospiraceae bacterium]|nr:tetratricopeptide repeat protein [Oscillospiraceae bacterium]